MLYVQQTLTPGEEVVHVGHFHWIYNVAAILNIVMGVVICMIILIGAVYVQSHIFHTITATTLLGQIKQVHPGIRLGAFLVMVLGLLRFAQLMMIKATTEIAVTTNRLVYKRGLVARYVGEMSIDRIEGVNVLQPILGRVFSYGRLMVRGMGVGEVTLPTIADPITMRKAIERARTS